MGLRPPVPSGALKARFIPPASAEPNCPGSPPIRARGDVPGCMSVANWGNIAEGKDVFESPSPWLFFFSDLGLLTCFTPAFGASKTRSGCSEFHSSLPIDQRSAPLAAKQEPRKIHSAKGKKKRLRVHVLPFPCIRCIPWLGRSWDQPVQNTFVLPCLVDYQIAWPSSNS
jgi:hypothetical protein